MNAAPASRPPTTPRRAAALRRIALLPPCSRLLLRGLGRFLAGGRLPGRWLALGLCRELAERALQVVEDEPHGRFRPCRRRDSRLALAHEEDAAVERRDLELHE